MSTKQEEFAKAATSQTNPGEFDQQDSILENGVLGDDDTNGISAGMLRFGDTDGEKYADKLDRVGNEIDDRE